MSDNSATEVALILDGYIDYKGYHELEGKLGCINIENDECRHHDEIFYFTYSYFFIRVCKKHRKAYLDGYTWKEYVLGRD